MLRFMFPILNSATNTFKPFVFMISILSIYHASIIALRQVDLKKLIAYSSVAHMGFVTLGLFSLNIYGFVGSLYIMISHGIVAGALFFLVGVLYDRYGSRNILDYGGLASTMPLFATTFFFFTLANLSFPGSSNFIGELFVLLGLCEIEMLTTILATLSIIFTSSYSIWAYNRISFGQINKKLTGFTDLNKIEIYILFILLFLMLLFGLKPSFLLFNFENLLFSYIKI